MHGCAHVEASGLGFFLTAVVGLAAYMASVGWNKANLIAGVGAFFVAIVGLVLALRPSGSRERSGVQVRMRKADAGVTAAESVDVPAGPPVLAEMHDVSGRNVMQWIRTHTRTLEAGRRTATVARNWKSGGQIRRDPQENIRPQTDPAMPGSPLRPGGAETMNQVLLDRSGGTEKGRLNLPFGGEVKLPGRTPVSESKGVSGAGEGARNERGNTGRSGERPVLATLRR